MSSSGCCGFNFNRITGGIIAAGLGCALFLLPVFASEPDKAEEETIENEMRVVSESTTLTGVVNELYQLVTDDGEVYFIAVGEVGDRLIEKPGQRFSVTGTILDDGGDLLIAVESFQDAGK